MSNNGCRAILKGRAQKDVLQLTREKRGQKVETKKMLDVPEIKKLVTYTK